MAAMTMRRQSIAIASPRAQGGKERHGFMMGGAAAAAAATAAHEADMKRKAKKTPIKKRRSAIKLSSSALNLAALPPTEEDAEYDELEPGGNNGHESREDTEDGAEDALLPGTPTR